MGRQYKIPVRIGRSNLAKRAAERRVARERRATMNAFDKEVMKFLDDFAVAAMEEVARYQQALDSRPYMEELKKMFGVDNANE